MSTKLQAIRGMHDILPDDTPLWRKTENIISGILLDYGYSEIRLPVVEKTELFARSIGDTTDIVSKEMYTFPDRNRDLLTLRPEGTAGCVRAVLEHGLIHNQVRKLWYSGPMFRHERPQKGRQRQFHQAGMEVFGLSGPDIDAELIVICKRIWDALGINQLTLELNTLANRAARETYKRELTEYFSAYRDKLDEDSWNRLQVNPLRLLDSKDPELQNLAQSAPGILDFLDDESAEHFNELRSILDSLDICYKVNPFLVRGLDYYGKTVFEWTTTALGAQGTVCAGGRYDGLVEHFGGKSTPAIGCAIGMERLVELVNQAGNIQPQQEQPQVYMVIANAADFKNALNLAESLRNQLDGLRLTLHSGGGGLKSQFKKADKSGALLALIIGQDELARGTVSVKFLRDESDQVDVPIAELSAFLGKSLTL